MLVFLRSGAALVVFPVLSSAQVPVRLRVSLAAMLAFLVAPTLPPQTFQPGLDFPGLVLVMVREVGVGLLMGFVSRLAFHALEFCAGIVGLEVGLNVAASFNPLSEARTEFFGTATFFLGAMLLFSLDLHHWMLAALQRSYALVPANHAGLSMPLYHEVLHRTAQVFQAGLVMAAPILAISFLISVTFALLSRAVPSMNVFAESFSFRILAGLLVFGMTLNLMAQHAANYLRRIPDDVLRVARLLSPG
jgi:flagellar biosynthetic protein FliR